MEQGVRLFSFRDIPEWDILHGFLSDAHVLLDHEEGVEQELFDKYRDLSSS